MAQTSTRELPLPTVSIDGAPGSADAWCALGCRIPPGISVTLHLLGRDLPIPYTALMCFQKAIQINHQHFHARHNKLLYLLHSPPSSDPASQPLVTDLIGLVCSFPNSYAAWALLGFYLANLTRDLLLKQGPKGRLNLPTVHLEISDKDLHPSKSQVISKIFKWEPSESKWSSRLHACISFHISLSLLQIDEQQCQNSRLRRSLSSSGSAFLVWLPPFVSAFGCKSRLSTPAFALPFDQLTFLTQQEPNWDRLEHSLILSLGSFLWFIGISHIHFNVSTSFRRHRVTKGNVLWIKGPIKDVDRHNRDISLIEKNLKQAVSSEKVRSVFRTQSQNLLMDVWSQRRKILLPQPSSWAVRDVSVMTTSSLSAGILCFLAQVVITDWEQFRPLHLSTSTDKDQDENLLYELYTVLRRALQLDPDNTIGWILMSKLLCKTNDPLDSNVMVSVFPLSLRASSYLKPLTSIFKDGSGDDHEEALCAASCAVNLEPDNPHTWWNLASVIGEYESHQLPRLAAEHRQQLPDTFIYDVADHSHHHNVEDITALPNVQTVDAFACLAMAAKLDQRMSRVWERLFRYWTSTLPSGGPVKRVILLGGRILMDKDVRALASEPPLKIDGARKQLGLLPCRQTSWSILGDMNLFTNAPRIDEALENFYKSVLLNQMDCYAWNKLSYILMGPHPPRSEYQEIQYQGTKISRRNVLSISAAVFHFVRISGFSSADVSEPGLFPIPRSRATDRSRRTSIQGSGHSSTPIRRRHRSVSFSVGEDHPVSSPESAHGPRRNSQEQVMTESFSFSFNLADKGGLPDLSGRSNAEKTVEFAHHIAETCETIPEQLTEPQSIDDADREPLSSRNRLRHFSVDMGLPSQQHDENLNNFLAQQQGSSHSNTPQTVVRRHPSGHQPHTSILALQNQMNSPPSNPVEFSLSPTHHASSVSPSSSSHEQKAHQLSALTSEYFPSQLNVLHRMGINPTTDSLPPSAITSASVTPETYALRRQLPNGFGSRAIQREALTPWSTASSRSYQTSVHSSSRHSPIQVNLGGGNTPDVQIILEESDAFHSPQLQHQGRTTDMVESVFNTPTHSSTLFGTRTSHSTNSRLKDLVQVLVSNTTESSILSPELYRLPQSSLTSTPAVSGDRTDSPQSLVDLSESTPPQYHPPSNTQGNSTANSHQLENISLNLKEDRRLSFNLTATKRKLSYSRRLWRSRQRDREQQQEQQEHEQEHQEQQEQEQSKPQRSTHLTNLNRLRDSSKLFTSLHRLSDPRTLIGMNRRLSSSFQQSQAETSSNHYDNEPTHY